MSHVGMHMPKMKDGLNWEVEYDLEQTCNGYRRTGVKQFRVRVDAENFIKMVRSRAPGMRTEGGVIAHTLKLRKIGA